MGPRLTVGNLEEACLLRDSLLGKPRCQLCGSVETALQLIRGYGLLLLAHCGGLH